MSSHELENIDFVHSFLQCLNAKPSQVIYDFLQEEGPQPVAEITVMLNKGLKDTRYREGRGRQKGTPNARIISSSSASQFLKLMKKLGIVCYKPEGKKNIHFINPEAEAFIKLISKSYEEHKDLLFRGNIGRDGLRDHLPNLQRNQIQEAD